MRKFLKSILSIMMVLMMAGCSNNDESVTVNILCPSGAPALAFVSEYEDINKNGKIDFVDGSDNLVAELTKEDSEYDMIVAPINVGARLISSDQTEYRMAAVITWGNLYYVATSEEALQEEGELALFGQGAVPEKIVEAVQIDTSLTPTYYNSATLVQQQLLAGNAKVGLLAEPAASATVAKGSEAGVELKIITDLQAEYGDGNGYPQAAIFVKNNDSFDQLYQNIDAFTNNGYEGLEEYLDEIGVENLNLPSTALVVSSMERQNVHYKEAKECTDEITEFLKLFSITFSEDMLVK